MSQLEAACQAVVALSTPSRTHLGVLQADHCKLQAQRGVELGNSMVTAKVMHAEALGQGRPPIGMVEAARCVSRLLLWSGPGWLLGLDIRFLGLKVGLMTGQPAAESVFFAYVHRTIARQTSLI